MSADKRDAWSRELFEICIASEISTFGYVPDAGNARLIAMAEAHDGARTILLTTEEEGVALCAGIDLGGKRAALLLQSSGVGNCVNFLGLAKAARFPIFMIVTMRGEYGERNPWQYAMGQAVLPVLGAMGFASFVVETREGLAVAADAAIAAAFRSGNGAALILSQRFLGAKDL